MTMRVHIYIFAQAGAKQSLIQSINGMKSYKDVPGLALPKPKPTDWIHVLQLRQNQAE